MHEVVALLPSPIVVRAVGVHVLTQLAPMRFTSSLCSFVTNTSLMIAAGAWSHMPMHGVHSSVILPSAVVCPKSMPSSWRNASATRALPCISSMMSLQRRTTTWPLVFCERKA